MCVCVCVYVYIYVCVCVCVYVYMYIYICVCVCGYKCIYIHKNAETYFEKRECKSKIIHILFTNIYIYMHIYEYNSYILIWKKENDKKDKLIEEQTNSLKRA